jgi:hypothetical protein
METIESGVNKMKRDSMIPLVIFLILFFGIPVLSGSAAIRGMSPKDLGEFLGSVLLFWRMVIDYALKKLRYP